MKLVARILLTALTLLLVAAYVPGVQVEGLYTALIAAVVLGLLNIFVRPVLILLTFPITLLTVGLFILVINASLFWFAASFIDGFTVSGFWPAFFGAVIVSTVSALGNRYL